MPTLPPAIVRSLTLSLAVGGLAAYSGMRHNRLVKAEPGIDAAVAAAPARIRLWFKESAEISVSSIKVTGADSTPVATGPVQVVDSATSIAVTITAPVHPGSYKVSWKTASADGHIIRGTYGFVVRP